MLLLLYCLQLLFYVWRRNGSCCCYIFYHYCLRYDRGVVHVVVILSTISVEGLTEEWFMLLLLYCISLLFKVWQSSGSCCCYIVYHYCLMYDREVVHVVVILSTITLESLTDESFMLLLLYCIPLLF
jgi:hypothetical protein